MTHDSYDDADIHEILQAARNIAVVGASANSSRPSHRVMAYLLAKGRRVVPVNPGHAGGTILGQTVYARLADIEEHIDMVDIFRNSQAAGGVVEEALAVKDRLGLRAIWMQLGVRNDVAAAAAERAGLKVVMDRCPKIEMARLGL